MLRTAEEGKMRRPPRSKTLPFDILAAPSPNLFQHPKPPSRRTVVVHRVVGIASPWNRSLLGKCVALPVRTKTFMGGGFEDITNPRLTVLERRQFHCV
jgi:hypothetical protein